MPEKCFGVAHRHGPMFVLQVKVLVLLLENAPMSMFRRYARQAVAPTAAARLRLESLEAREVPAIDLLSIANSDFPSNKPLFVPVGATTDVSTHIDYSVSSNNSSVSAEVVTGGRSVQLTVSGKDSNGVAFSGTIQIRLFENIAPLATGNIINLVKSGYYVNKEFHRVVNDFVIQGGSPNGDGQGGASTISDVRDEYDPQYTFASRGIVAMANAGDDNNNAQFFITDPFILSNGTEVDAPLDRRSQFLNFNHTIVGILVDGFDTYQKIMNVPKVLGSDGAVSQPTTDVLITAAKIIETAEDKFAVLKISANGGFLGNADITVTGTQDTASSRTFTVTSVADTVNDRPFLGQIANQTTTVNKAAEFTLPFTELDSGDSPTFTVGKVVNTANGPVFTTLDPAQGTASVDATGRVTFTPATGFTGIVSLTVGVRDAQDRIGSSLGLNDARNFDTQKIDVNVGNAPTNTAPTISDIANQTAATGQTNTVTFTVGDSQTAAANLIVSATSSNTTLVPSANLVFGGTGATRTLAVSPVSGQTGTATITVTVKDEGDLTATDTYTFTVSGTVVPATVTLTSTKTSVGIGRGVLFTATVSSGAGTVQFLDGTTVIGNVPVIDNKALLTTNFSTAADHSVTAKFIPNSGDPVTSTAQVVTVTSSTGPVVITAEGQAAGTQSKVVIKNQDGTTRFTVDPYSGFKGVIRVKVADVTNDGQLDVVAVPGFGGGPLITVYDGSTGKLTYQKMIFEERFRGGLSLDVGDARGLGYAQILVGAGQTGGPRVTLLDAVTDKVLLNYFAYSNASRGGVSVAIGDLRGGNQANIITGAGEGLAPNVNVYNPYSAVGFETPRLYGTFIAGSKTDTSGIRVGTGPLIDNSRRDVLVGDLDKTDITPLDQPFNPIALGVFVG